MEKGKSVSSIGALGFTTSMSDTVYVYSATINAGLSNFEMNRWLEGLLLRSTGSMVFV